MIDITGYDGLYAITDDGKVWSYRKNKFLKPFLARGYSKVRLYTNDANKQFLIHRLVAEAFLPNPQNLPQINHKDENKLNNSVDNLEWCDAKYNINYGEHNKNVARSHCKKVYCIELDKVFESAKSAAIQLNLSDSNIAKCCKGKYKTTGGYHWEYTDQTAKETIKAEAIKEFADLAIKSICEKVSAPTPSESYIVEKCNQVIDDLVKEMVGEE